MKRHGGKVDGFVIIEVKVPRSWLRRHSRGLWVCLEMSRPSASSA
jgi:hypothetical protein